MLHQIPRRGILFFPKHRRSQSVHKFLNETKKAFRRQAQLRRFLEDQKDKRMSAPQYCIAAKDADHLSDQSKPPPSPESTTQRVQHLSRRAFFVPYKVECCASS